MSSTAIPGDDLAGDLTPGGDLVVTTPPGDDRIGVIFGTVLRYQTVEGSVIRL